MANEMFIPRKVADKRCIVGLMTSFYPAASDFGNGGGMLDRLEQLDRIDSTSILLRVGDAQDTITGSKISSQTPRIPGVMHSMP